MGRKFRLREGLIFLAIVVGALLIVAALSPAYPQGIVVQAAPQSTTIFTTSMSRIEFYDHGKPVVTIILKDGSVHFGEGISPDEASKKFWNVLGRFYIQLCSQDGRPGESF